MPSFDTQYVLICYSPVDKVTAEKLYSQLKGEGIEVELSWPLSITQDDENYLASLQNVGHLLIIVTQTAIHDVRILSQWQVAADEFIPVIPIFIEKVSIPSQFASSYYLDFDYYDDPKQVLNELIETLQAYRGVASETNIFIPDRQPQLIESQDDIALLEVAQTLCEEKKISEAVAIYIHILEYGQSVEVRTLAARAIGELHIDQSPLIAALMDKFVPEDVRKEAALALSRRKTSDARGALQVATIQDVSVAVRLYASVSMMLLESPNRVLSWLNDLASNDINSILSETIGSLQLRIHEFIRDASQHVFISYAHSDTGTFPNDLATELRKANFLVWIDTNLEPSTPVWEHEIEKAIEHSGVCIVILSPAALNSEWVANEIHYAKQFGKPIIPIKYIETYRPLSLITLQGLRNDLPFAEHFDSMLPLLLNALDKFVTRTH
jgi:hypothetical protein